MMKGNFTKIFSDYMLYLLLNQTNVLSAVAGVSQVIIAWTLLWLEDLNDHAIKDVKGLCKTVDESSVLDFLDWKDVATGMGKAWGYKVEGDEQILG